MSTTHLARLLVLVTCVALLVACGPTAPGAAAPGTQTEAQTETQTETPAANEPATAPAQAEEDADTAASDALPTGLVTYVIIPEESSASYIVNEEFFGLALGKYGIPAGLSDTVGTTSAIEGQFELNWDDLSAPLGNNSFTVDLSTLESNQRLRDEWIRENGPEFGTYPNATFVAESLEGAPASYTPGEEVTFQMVGQMTIRETTQPTTFEITAKLENDTVTGVATANLTMSDFGITPPDFANTLTVADDFRVEVNFTARAQ